MKGMIGGGVFFPSSPPVLSDTLDSSTTKTTHFKGSEDGAGDLRELKDRRGNFGPSLPNSRGKKRGW